jgi:hypothetical protein
MAMTMIAPRSSMMARAVKKIFKLMGTLALRRRCQAKRRYPCHWNSPAMSPHDQY